MQVLAEQAFNGILLYFTRVPMSVLAISVFLVFETAARQRVLVGQVFDA
jgi:hypothetical protein